MDGTKPVNATSMSVACDPKRKKDTNRRSRKALFDAHGTLSAHLTEQRNLPITMERQRFIKRFAQVLDAIELAYSVSKDLNRETPRPASKDAA